MKTLLVVLGTRPEAIKLAPFILRAKNSPAIKLLVCSTGQHREMIRPIFEFFGIVPDFDLDLMKPGQSLSSLSVGIMEGLSNIISSHSIDGVVVQGDTTSCFIASLVAFYSKIPVIHIEAGLRSGDIFSPFPEEFNRKATGLIAKLHFAPTETARQNLIREHYSPESIFVTGNTGIDALFETQRKLSECSNTVRALEEKYSFLNSKKKLILVTVHRRESFGAPMEEIMRGLLALSKRSDVQILFPLHMNPEVRRVAANILGKTASWINIEGRSEDRKSGSLLLCDPIEYIPFVYLMGKSYFIITDSGGIQEEAPSLGKPVLVAREKTERPEAIDAGTSKLIPLNENLFFQQAKELLEDKDLYLKMANAKNPFGSGDACDKILKVISEKL